MKNSEEQTHNAGKCILSERRTFERNLFRKFEKAVIKNERDLIISADDTKHK
jgi:hypothetical protein